MDNLQQEKNIEENEISSAENTVRRPIRGSMIYKTAIMILAAVAGAAAVWLSVMAVTIFIDGEHPSGTEIKETQYENLLSTYAAAFIDGYVESGYDEDRLSDLDGGNILYTVTYMNTKVLYTNDDSVNKHNYMSHMVWDHNTYFTYDIGNYWDALDGSQKYTKTATAADVLGGHEWYAVYLSVADDAKPGLALNGGWSDWTARVPMTSALFSAFYDYCWLFAIIFIAVFVLLFVLLMFAAGRRREADGAHARKIDRMPFLLYAAMLAAISLVAATLGRWAYDALMISGMHSIFKIIGAAVVWVLTFGVFLCIQALCMSLAVRIATGTFWQTSLVHALYGPITRGATALSHNVSFFVKAIVGFAVVALIEYAVFATGMRFNPYNGIVAVFWVIKILEFIALLWILWQMKLIKDGGERVAAGDYGSPIDTKKMAWDFKKHAENINSVRDGISVAVEERMKSEKFKAELITNVSHDIKTPLTSIINYVDLLKKEDMGSQEAREYVDVLDRQSARLKKLLDDLIEASKASTGSIPLEMEECDASVLLAQVVGEFEDRIEKAGLELIVKGQDGPAMIMADGRHLWRVIDNLMANICKYSLAGSHVYITLETVGGMVIMTFKNISRSPLGASGDELMERFVRGDSSRNTEGSGLGLSIAQSLTVLMGGNLAVMTDGDLFKAIVSFPAISESQ